MEVRSIGDAVVGGCGGRPRREEMEVVFWSWRGQSEARAIGDVDRRRSRGERR